MTELSPAEHDKQRGRQRFYTEAEVRGMLPARLHVRHDAFWQELETKQLGFVHIYGDIDIAVRGETLNLCRPPEGGQQLNTKDIDRYTRLLQDLHKPLPRLQASNKKTPYGLKQDYANAWSEVKKMLEPNGIKHLVSFTGINSPTPWLDSSPKEFAAAMRQCRSKAKELGLELRSPLMDIEKAHKVYQKSVNPGTARER